MDRPIRVGDLVVVVSNRECCGNADAVGEIFRVSRIVKEIKCSNCGPLMGVYAVDAKDDYMRAHISRLKRIDPDILADDVPTNEELHV